MSSTLARRSAVVLALLFGLVFAVGTGVMWYLKQPAWLAVLFAVAVVGLQFAIGPWIIERIYAIRWVEPEAVHPEFAAWYRESCRQRNIPVPRFGIIDDGNPNAFTYGHTPRYRYGLSLCPTFGFRRPAITACTASNSDLDRKSVV